MKRFLNKLLGFGHRRTPRQGRSNAFRPQLEILEGRELLSLAFVNNHTLMVVAADGAANNLTVKLDQGNYVLTDTRDPFRTGLISSASTVTTPAGQFDRIEIHLKDRTDILRVESTGVPIAVFAGTGDDIITVGSTANGLNGIAARVTVNGEGQATTNGDRLTIDDAASAISQIYDIEAGRVSRNAAIISYIGVEQLVVNAGTTQDFILVGSTNRRTTVNAGGGDDVITVGNSTLAVSQNGAVPGIAGIQGLLTINGGSQATADGDILTVMDAPTNTPQSYNLTDGQVARTGHVATIIYRGLERLNVDAGTADDTITLRDTSPGTRTTINAGPGNDTIDIRGTDPGASTTVNGDFTDDSEVVQGNGGDTVRIGAGFSTAGSNGPLTLDGGDGKDWLDFSGWTAGVNVNIGGDASASGFAHARDVTNATEITLQQFENVLGGRGADLLTGNASSNVLVGGAGDDILFGFGSRDVLIGGNGADNLFGGAGEDLLIGGRTAYDSNRTSLEVIQREWQGIAGSTNYLSRIHRLTGTNNGDNSSVLLDALHVFDEQQPARDNLQGNDGVAAAQGGSDTELDWFWIFGTDQSNRGNPAGEIQNDQLP